MSAYSTLHTTRREAQEIIASQLDKLTDEQLRDMLAALDYSRKYDNRAIAASTVALHIYYDVTNDQLGDMLDTLGRERLYNFLVHDYMEDRKPYLTARPDEDSPGGFSPDPW